MTFGKYAKERVRKLGKSQKALAEQLRVSPAYISQIFTGKKNPPDLGRPKNRGQLRTWALFLETPEEGLLDLIRHELHRIPLRPRPRYPAMRELLLGCLEAGRSSLADEIGSMEFHPAESRALQSMVQIYLVLHEDFHDGRAYAATRFKDFCRSAVANREFVETTLAGFFKSERFTWRWDPQTNEILFQTESRDITDALEKVESIYGNAAGRSFGGTVPVVGHVSAGEGFEYTDGGYYAGEGFDQVSLPPGIDPSLAERLYCVKVRGDSLREFFCDGALLFIKPESWEEIKDGDLVIFRDSHAHKAFVKKVEFAGDNLILKSMNAMYKNIVVAKMDLLVLERVMAIVL
jgi:phage repressor protein C with HTH and peptisase S24 domain/transcriptional regulator with XRE-family HTH domain